MKAHSLQHSWVGTCAFRLQAPSSLMASAVLQRMLWAGLVSGRALWQKHAAPAQTCDPPALTRHRAWSWRCACWWRRAPRACAPSRLARRRSWRRRARPTARSPTRAPSRPTWLLCTPKVTHHPLLLSWCVASLGPRGPWLVPPLGCLLPSDAQFASALPSGQPVWQGRGLALQARGAPLLSVQKRDAARHGFAITQPRALAYCTLLSHQL